ncbi:MAG TPA: NADH-quinone oxidoreductase subunit L [Kofleriaceae bacterium]
MDPTQIPTLAQVSAASKFAGLPLLAWIAVLPLAGALINLTIGRRLSRQAVHTIAIAAVAASCGIAIYMVFGPLMSQFRADPRLGGEGISQTVFTWIEVGSFRADLAFRLDTLSAVMVLIVTFVGTLIHIYSTGYMAHDPRPAAFFGYLNLFTGAMLLLVLGANMPVMFIGWEGVGLCSYLLIGFWFERSDYATAGRKAFVVNRIGDFFFLLGMFLLFQHTSTLDFQALEGQVDKFTAAGPWFGDRLALAAGLCLFIGACGKSAQLPLYVWLPDAMAGPTPVSALIHAATMVTAGVYMCCRMSYLYASSPAAMAVVATIGLLTALAAAFMAFAQTDLKKVLAYSTVSQLGFMFVAVGTGNWIAAIFHLGTHAFFKACLFLGAGSVMHAMEHAGSDAPGDIMKMGGLRKRLKITHATFLISCLAIAGIFPFAGFFSKDEILGGAFSVSPPDWMAGYGKVLWVGLLIAALGTAFYMWRLYFLVFGGEARSEAAKTAHESPGSMTFPLVVLAFLATVAGVIGMPHISGLPSFTHGLSTWLAPSVVGMWQKPPANFDPVILHHPHGTTLYVLLGVALGIGILGIGLAYVFYGGKRGPSETVEKLVEGPLQPVYEASKNKLWVDEIYDRVFVRPFKWLASGLYEIADKFVIDTIAVNGAAMIVGLFSRVSRWFQNGQVQRYLAGLVVGAAAVFFVTDCKHSPAFTIEWASDTELRLRANPGAGIIGETSKVGWEINGSDVSKSDWKPDHEGTEAMIRPGDVIGGVVTLVIEDGVTRKRRTISRPIPVVETAPAKEAQ